MSCRDDIDDDEDSLLAVKMAILQAPYAHIIYIHIQPTIIIILFKLYYSLSVSFI